MDRGLINTADDQAGYGGFAVRSYVREGIKQRSNLGGGLSTLRLINVQWCPISDKLDFEPKCHVSSILSYQFQ